MGKTITMPIEEYERIMWIEEDRENFDSIYYLKYEERKKEYEKCILSDLKSFIAITITIIIIETSYIIFFT